MTSMDDLNRRVCIPAMWNALLLSQEEAGELFPPQHFFSMCVLPFKFTSLDFYAESFHGSETTALCRIFGSFCFRLFARKCEIHLASLVKVRRCCRFAGEKFFYVLRYLKKNTSHTKSFPPFPQSRNLLERK